MDLESFLSRLEQVKRSKGGGYMARCPAHADRTPSLSVREEDGRILVKCFGQCETATVVQSMGLAMHDLFIEDRRAATVKQPGMSSGPVVARYEYRIADGSPLYRVCRREPKGFFQERWDGRAWVPGLGAVEPTLYHLPELLHAEAGSTIFIAEGEKDVDALRERGVLATCNSGGAGKFRAEYAEVMRARNVVIIQDKDKPGRKHGAEVFGMMQGVAASVRLVEAKEGKDATDHFDAGWGIDDFVEVQPTKAEGFAKGYRLQRIGDMLDEPPEEHSWLVDELFIMGGTSLTGAKPKVGKSTLLRHLAFCVSRGLPFLGRATVKGPVIYLAIEEKKAQVIAQFRAMGCSDEDDIHIHTGSTPIEALELLLVEIERIKPVLVIVDPLFKWVKVQDASDYARVSQALEPVIELSRQTGAHFALSHHLGKGDREDGDSVLGSTAIFGAVDTLLVLRKSSEHRTARSTNRYGEDLEECVLVLDKESSGLSLSGSLESYKIGAVLVAISELLRAEPELQEKEIRERIGGNTSLTGKALRGGLEDGRFIRTGLGKSKNPYLYSLSDVSVSRFSPMVEKENEKTRTVEREV